MLKTSTMLDTKRLSLTLPLALYEELERVATERQGASVPELLRSFVRLGLLILQEGQEGEAVTVVLRKGEKERELFLL